MGSKASDVSQRKAPPVCALTLSPRIRANLGCVNENCSPPPIPQGSNDPLADLKTSFSGSAARLSHSLTLKISRSRRKHLEIAQGSALLPEKQLHLQYEDCANLHLEKNPARPIEKFGTRPIKYLRGCPSSTRNPAETSINWPSWKIVKHQFGVDLSAMHYRTEDFVPELFHTLRDELICNNGLEYQYIYRTSPDNESLQKAKEAIDAGRFIPCDFRDPSIYACLIKQLLREFPSPLLGKVPQKCIESTLRDLSDDPDGYTHGSSIMSLNHEIPGNLLLDRTMRRLMIYISSQELHVLLWLLDHMLEITSHESQNKMNLMALSIVMAPNLYTANSVNLCAAAKITGQVAELIKALLVWRENVWKAYQQEAHEFFSESLDTSMEGLTLPLATLSPSRLDNIDSHEFYGTHEYVDMKIMYIAKPLTHLLRDSFAMCVSVSLTGYLESELVQDGSMCESLYLSHQNRFIQSLSAKNIEGGDCTWISTICNHINISDAETRKNLTFCVDFSGIEHYPSLYLWINTVLCIKKFHSMLKSERQAQINIERLRAKSDSSILR